MLAQRPAEVEYVETGVEPNIDAIVLPKAQTELPKKKRLIR